MAHFAKLDENNIVLEVHTVANAEAPDEATGIAFLRSWSAIAYGVEWANWKQTSYNAGGDPKKRFNFAGAGYIYDPVRDAFIEPQPFPSWSLDEADCQWKAPTPPPLDGKQYRWAEDLAAWAEV